MILTPAPTHRLPVRQGGCASCQGRSLGVTQAQAPGTLSAVNTSRPIRSNIPIAATVVPSVVHATAPRTVTFPMAPPQPKQSSNKNVASSDEEGETTLSKVMEEIGSDVWKGMHRLAARWSDTPTEKEKQWSKKYFESAGHMIPCRLCRRHYLEFFYRRFKNGNREELFGFTVDAHNNANILLKKPIISVDKAKHMYAF